MRTEGVVDDLPVPGTIEAKLAMVLSIWSQENQVKTAKLAFYGLFNTILVGALGVADSVWPVALIGIIISAVWVFSIGRTVAFQRIWEVEIRKLLEMVPDHPIRAGFAREFEMPWYGRVSSKFILVATPIAGALAWLAIGVGDIIFNFNL